MSGIFAYCRVAPASELTSTSQLRALATTKGFAVDPDNMVIEVASASVPVSRRPGWRRLLDRLCDGDTLVVPGLDSLGSDVAEVHATIKLLASMGVRVHCLALGRMNLAGAHAKRGASSPDRARGSVRSASQPEASAGDGSPQAPGGQSQRRSDRPAPADQPPDHHATACTG
jgi:hypothetical protein